MCTVRPPSHHEEIRPGDDPGTGANIGELDLRCA